MKEKRRDSKERILHTGESQRTDGKYFYKIIYVFLTIFLYLLKCPQSLIL